LAVIAANVTDETVGLLESVLASEEFVRFSNDNKLNLSDKTILIRLALINLQKHLPAHQEVIGYKAALLRPHEFDDFWKKILGVEVNVS
jgi:hypothetical protein